MDFIIVLINYVNAMFTHTRAVTHDVEKRSRETYLLASCVLYPSAPFPGTLFLARRCY